MTEQSGAPPAPPANAAEASSRLTELGADKAWAQRFYGGDTGARQDFERLTTMIANDGKKIDMAMSGALPELHDGDLSHMAGLADMLRESGIRDEVIRETLAGGKVTKAEFDATKAWLDQHLNDKIYVAKWLNGDVEARQKFLLAHIITSSEIKVA